MVTLDSYLKDTTSLISIIQHITWEPDFIWATLDVISLYSNIPHAKGLWAVSLSLENDTQLPNTEKQFILDSIKYILKHNLFNFNNDLYLQTCETAMGMRFAPSFTNVYMGHFETSHIMTDQLWRENIIIYMRYIDDLIFIWKVPQTEFKLFTKLY